MKKLFAMLTPLALVLAVFTGCAGKPSSEVSQAPSVPEVSLPAASLPTPAEPQPAEELEWGGDYAIHYPQDIRFDEWESLDATNTTALQREMVVALVNKVIQDYQRGELPRDVVQGSEYFLNEPMPQGAVLPQAVIFEDITQRNFDEFWQVIATVPAGETQLNIVLNNVSFSEEGMLMVVEEARWGEL